MSIKLRVMGGASAPPNFATITVNPSDTIATASVITALVEATKAAQTAVASAKISPVIKGKKGDPLTQSDTFSSRGVGNNDVLFVSLPLSSSGKSKPPPPSSSPPSSPAASPPKAAPSSATAAKALDSPTKTTTSASPKTAPAAPVSMKKTFGTKTTAPASPTTGTSGPSPPRAASPPTTKSTAAAASPPSSPVAPKSKSSAPASASTATSPPSATLKKKVPPTPSSSSPASASPVPSRASSVAPPARPSSASTALGSTKTRPPLATASGSGSPKTKPSSDASTPAALLPSVTAVSPTAKKSSSGKSSKVNEKDSTNPLDFMSNDSLALTNSFVQKLGGGKASSSSSAKHTAIKGRAAASEDDSDTGASSSTGSTDDAASSSTRQKRATSTSKSRGNNNNNNNNKSGTLISKNRSESISSISSSSGNSSGSDDDKRSSKKKIDKGNIKSKEEVVKRGEGKADKGKASLSRSKKRGYSSSSGSSASSSAHPSRSSSSSSGFSSSRKNKSIKNKKEVPSGDVHGKNAPASSDSDQKKQKELAQTVEKELKVARAEMAALWEKQREDVQKQYEKQESERFAALKAMAEKEEQISKAQEKFISALQHRHEKETKNDEQLEELFRANRELREELSKRREASDKKLQELADLHAKNAILNPDTRVDNLLLVQTQIAQSLRAFNNLPSALLGGGSHREGASSEFGIAETTPLPIFLSTLGLERFLLTLRAQDITTSILLRMTEKEMAEAGIDTLGARKRILLEKSRRELAVAGGGMGGLITTLGGGTSSSSPERSHQFQNPLSIVGSPQAEAFVKAVNEVTAINSHYAAASSSPARDTTTFGSPIVGLGVAGVQSRLVNLNNNTSNNAGNNNFSQIEQLHVKVLKALFKKHEPAMIERAEAIVRTFNRQGGLAEGPAINTPKSAISDVYDALCLKYGIIQTAYYSTLVAYLTERCPALLPAAHSICSLFEGREAEFCEAVEFVMCGINASSSLPSNYPSLWVQFFPNNNSSNSSGGSSSYYYSSLCGLSQVKEPKRSTDIFKVRDRQFSVSAEEENIGSPSRGATKVYHSVFLGPGGERKTPGRASSSNNNNTKKSERASSVSPQKRGGGGGGGKALEKDTSASTSLLSPTGDDAGCALYSSPSSLPPNPNIEDDASSYDNMYVSMFAAFIVKKHPTKIASVPAILKDFKGRERDLLYQAQAGLLVF